MCRLYGFRSSVLSGVHTSLVHAENALALQSLKHPDGWGIAHYQGRFPHLIKNDRQALEDGLFRDVSAIVATRTLIAHIRQATAGKVNILNCHPFQHGPWTFAHNGTVVGFGTEEGIRERLLDCVDPRFRRQILGQTDSEVCFFIFLSHLARRVEDIHHDGIRSEVVVEALGAAVEQIRSVCPDRDGKPNSLTFLTTNGAVMVGIRFRRPLWFSTYKTRCPERDTCHAFEEGRCEREVTDGIVKHMIVASERVAANPNVWVELQDGDWVSVDHGMNFRRGHVDALRETRAPVLPLLAQC
jgi:predicted glutamine amidotransferase